MKNDTMQPSNSLQSRSVFHPATPEDKTAMIAMRKVVEPNKGKLKGAAARGPYDDIMNRVVAPDGVTYEEDTVSRVSGWWCRPEGTRTGEAICHLHGGWFNFGSAKAFRHLVGHIAASVGVAAFIPDYRLAPENPFPAAVEDVRACFDGLLTKGFRKIAVTGDSAGGGLALVLLSQILSEPSGTASAKPVGAVVLSPTTDLALTGETWVSRAETDPYFIKGQVNEMVQAYLGEHDRFDPAASPLYGSLQGSGPIRVHVGNDEVLLDDSRRFVERAVDAGVDVRLDIWEEMTHGFLSGIGKLAASSAALDLISTFLKEQFTMTQV